MDAVGSAGPRTHSRGVCRALERVINHNNKLPTLIKLLSTPTYLKVMLQLRNTDNKSKVSACGVIIKTKHGYVNG